MKIQQKRFFWTLSPLALGFLFTCFALLIDAKGNKTAVTVSLPKIPEQEVVVAPCAFGQVEEMDSHTCVWPRLPHQDKARRSALDSAVEARLGRVVAMIDGDELAKGLKLLTPPLVQGHPRAQLLAAELYRRGVGVPRNETLRLELLKVAASQGEPSAQFALAEKLTRGCTNECPQMKEAMAYYLSASDAGFAKAIQELARIHFQGIGVPEDKSAALPFIIRAAEAGLVESQRVLAHLYLEGEVMEGSPELALNWYEKAAANNDFQSMARAGLMYLRGQGTASDRVVGLGYLWMAAKAGEGLAQLVLGDCLINERFGVSDRLSGLMWLKLAARNDVEEANKFLNAISAKPSPTEESLSDTMVQKCLSSENCGSEPWLRLSDQG